MSPRHGLTAPGGCYLITQGLEGFLIAEQGSMGKSSVQFPAKKAVSITTISEWEEEKEDKEEKEEKEEEKKEVPAGQLANKQALRYYRPPGDVVDNLSGPERRALEELIQNPNIIIKPADKGTMKAGIRPEQGQCPRPCFW
ncbi:unnamed protein product [Pleuronectes platessa]|uniref:Uncharacterized protein n=1 Tax=Pleuronectes platessa TaxID=8262 RepID=A0A9N7W305_PLEPL|nr:unnamed protein product [Pleuronectes platessa]